MFSRKVSYQANAVVTGAGSGIGAAFATALAKRGGRVVCADIDLTRARRMVRDIERSGGQALAVECDVASLDAVQTLALKSEQWFNAPVNLVINNAGVGVGGEPVGDIPIEDWRWAIDINLWGVIHGCHVFAPILREQKHAGLINVCSTASFAAGPGMGPYNASKAAALAVTETLAAEMAGTGVHVTALCPTWVKTNIAEDGRISPQASDLARRAMAMIGMSADKVAEQTLHALDKNRLYVLPQRDARMIWRSKRIAPAGYARGAGLLNRFMTSRSR